VESYDDEMVIKNLFPKKKGSKKKGPVVIGSDDLLVELQVMFGCLQESLRQHYNPKGFCFANKVRVPLARRHADRSPACSLRGRVTQ
jgi:hypothetical protein